MSFRTQANGSDVAVITEPLAAKSQLDATFRRHGFDISVNVVPVSPSLVGSIVYSDIGVEPLQSGACFGGGGGGCWVGLVIPNGFTGQGNVTVGRAARPGEAYASTADAFGPGEVLHCSGLLNAPVSDALPVLKATSLKVVWAETSPANTQAPLSNGATSTRAPEPVGPEPVASPKITESPPAGSYVVSAIPISSTTVQVDTSPQPGKANASLIGAASQGC
ncbi:MAG: hypothetical protein ACRDX8_03915 [Acidimicrobiales bacterium]